MKHFFRTGRGLSFGKGELFSYQSKQYKPIGLHSPLNRDGFVLSSGSAYPFINDSLSFHQGNIRECIGKHKGNDREDPNKSRKEDEKGVNNIQGYSTQVQPLFDARSTYVPVFYHRTLIATVPGSDQRTEPIRSLVGTRSEKSRARLGLGRFLVEKKQVKVHVEGSNVTPVGFETKSCFVRDLFGSASSAVRRYIEAQSNKRRRIAEAVSNLSRRSLEAESKSSRRTVEESVLNFGGFAEEVKNTRFFKGPRTKVEVGVNSSQCVKVSAIPLDRLRTVYAKQRQLKSTCLKHESYILDTCPTHVQHMNDTSTTHERHMKDTSNAAVRHQRENGAVVDYINDLRVNRLILESFRALCEEFRAKVEPVLIDEKTKAQNGLKSVALKICILPMIFCVLFSSAYSQGAIVGDPAKAPEISQVYRPYLQGKVTSKDPNLSLSTKVFIEGTDIRAYSNKEGEFNFRGLYVEAGNIMVYSKVLNKFIRVPFDTKDRGPFTISLDDSIHSSNKQIDTVAIVAETGYFKVPEERATGSFVHINNKLLSRTVGSNILDRLNGVTRGLIFNNNNVGATTFASNRPSMSIRGISTLFANAEPLIILDNFPFEGDINTINPEDIESVTVLQDAAASSIWGARAGNGVIVLTSKKGKFEQPLKVSVRTDVSISEKPNLFYNPTIPMDEVIEIERFLYEKGAWDGKINQVYPYITPTIEALLAHRNGHIDEAEMERRIAQLKTQDVRRDLNKYVYRPVQLYKGAVNFLGGAKQHNYYFSAGYDKNLGNIAGHHDERITLQARNSYRMLNNKLLFDVDLGFSTDKKRTGGDAPYQVLYDRIADENGNPLSIGGGRSPGGLRQSYIDTAGMGLLKDWNFYPLDNIHQYAVSIAQTSYRVQPSISYKPFDWLGLSANYQFSRSYSETEAIMDNEYFDQRDLQNRFTKINYSTAVAESPIPEGARLNQTNRGLSSHYFRGSFNVDKTWLGIHQFHLVGGLEVNSRNTLNRYMPTMMGYMHETESYVPFDPTVRRYQYLTGGTSTAIGISSNMSRNTTINRNRLFFGNASYTYDKRYTATFSARKDEANIFGVAINQRGRPFWSAGLRWQIHEEVFFKVDWLSKLALRATHGYTGNIGSSSAYITSSIASDPFFYTNKVYQTISNPPNPELSWENVRMSNLALDFLAFNGRLLGSIEHYRKKATELLSSQPINPSSGVTSLNGNWSSLKGWGWDINLTGKNIQSKDFLWQSDLILSYVSEMVTDYKRKPTTDRMYLTSSLGQYPIEGKPLYGIYSFASAGLDANGQPQGYLDGQLSQDYTNIYNNTRLGDYVYHGRATPNLFGSIRNSFQYKTFDLSFNISGQFGYFIRRNGLDYGQLYSVSSYRDIPFQYDYVNRWQQAGDELRTHVPAAAYPVVANRETFYKMTEHLVERGDHIRLRDIRLGYTLKLPQLGISSVQVYGYANNLGVLWAANKLGFDPDVAYSNAMVYPAARTYSLGFNVNF